MARFAKMIKKISVLFFLQELLPQDGTLKQIFVNRPSLNMWAKAALEPHADHFHHPVGCWIPDETRSVYPVQIHILKSKADQCFSGFRIVLISPKWLANPIA